MTSSSATPLTEMPATEFRPGHTVIFEPLGEPCSVACTCGGLLEPTPDAKHTQLARFQAHLEETPQEEALP
jgi:hypothetical protein